MDLFGLSHCDVMSVSDMVLHKIPGYGSPRVSHFISSLSPSVDTKWSPLAESKIRKYVVGLYTVLRVYVKGGHKTAVRKPNKSNSIYQYVHSQLFSKQLNVW